jgi:hypothetical protein
VARIPKCNDQYMTEQSPKSTRLIRDGIGSGASKGAGLRNAAKYILRTPPRRA